MVSVKDTLTSPFNRGANLYNIFYIAKKYRGLCGMSAFSFAAYGGFLVSSVNQDFEGGYRYGNIALKVLDRLSSKGQHRVSWARFSLFTP